MNYNQNRMNSRTDKKTDGVNDGQTEIKLNVPVTYARKGGGDIIQNLLFITDTFKQALK